MIKLNMSELLAFLQTLINITRLSGRFASFYFECEHFRFVYILRQKQNNFADFIKKIGSAVLTFIGYK